MNNFSVAQLYDPNLNIAELEKLYLIKAMEYFKNDKKKAADALGITIKLLYLKIHEFELYERYVK